MYGTTTSAAMAAAAPFWRRKLPAVYGREEDNMESDKYRGRCRDFRENGDLKFFLPNFFSLSWYPRWYSYAGVTLATLMTMVFVLSIVTNNHYNNDKNSGNFHEALVADVESAVAAEYHRPSSIGYHRIRRQAAPDDNSTSSTTSTTTVNPSSSSTTSTTTVAPSTSSSTTTSTTTVAPSTSSSTTTSTTTVAPSTSSSTTTSTTTVAPSTSSTTTSTTTAAPSTSSTTTSTTKQPGNATNPAPNVWGTSNRTIDEHGNVWIQPSSRPYLISDNDETVSCSENEFQSTCLDDDLVKATRNYSSSCMNFYNASDTFLYWYQEVQASAIFIPSSWTYWRANSNNRCPLLPLVNFYMIEESKFSVKFVETKRGVNLTNYDLYGTINVCYKTPEPNMRHVPNILTRFVQCLALYGEGLGYL